MTHIQRFLRGLNDFASVCKEDLSDMRYKEQDLNTNFQGLQSSVKKSLLHNERMKSKKAYESPLAMRRRLYPSEIPLKPPPREKRQTQSDMALRPVPFPTRYYALRAQPCKAAKRLYQPRALMQRQEERLEQIDEYMKYPNEERASNLDGRVDPVLHIGTFAPDEFQWATPVESQIL